MVLCHLSYKDDKIALRRTSLRYAAYGIEPFIPVYDRQGTPFPPTVFERTSVFLVGRLVSPSGLTVNPYRHSNV